MSEFASMLASFKKTASSSSQQQRPGNSSSSLKQQQQRQQSKKRPHHNNNSNVNAYKQHSSTPSFPSMHSNTRKYNNEDGFELSFLVIGAQKAASR